MIARAKWLGGAVAGMGAFVVACGTLIGTRDLTLVDPDGGASATDASLEAGCTSATDLQTDGNNCGACGHSCLGGACSSGACQPISIATGQDGAYAVAVDDTSVYWVSYTGNTVMMSAKNGSGLTQLATFNVDSPIDIALDANYVYWANNGGSIARCAKTGCGGTGEVLATNLSNPTGVAVDATHVFWAEYLGYDVGRVNTDGGAFGYLQTNLDSHSHMVAVDDASVFFTTDDTIGSMPKGSPTVPNSTEDASVGFKSIARVTIPAFGVAVDDTNVYWIENDDPGVVAFAPKSGAGPVTTLAGSQHYPIRVALDATNVYWTAYGPDTAPNDNSTLYLSGYVATCPKTGCSAGQTILAGALKDAEGIAVDSEAVYWTVAGNTSGEGAIMKLAK